MANKSHHIVYWDKSSKKIKTETPKDWARNHRRYFPKKTFTNSDTTPTTEEIGKVLKDKFNFVEFTYDEVIVLCNFDTKRSNF